MGIAERRPGSGFAAVGVNTLDAAEVEVADSATYHYSSTGFVVWPTNMNAYSAQGLKPYCQYLEHTLLGALVWLSATSTIS